MNLVGTEGLEQSLEMNKVAREENLKSPILHLSMSPQSFLYSYILSLQLPQKVTLQAGNSQDLTASVHEGLAIRVPWPPDLTWDTPFSTSHMSRRELACSQWYAGTSLCQLGRASCDTQGSQVITGHSGSIYTMAIGKSYKSELFLFLVEGDQHSSQTYPQICAFSNLYIYFNSVSFGRSQV